MLFVFSPRDNILRQIGSGTVRNFVELGVFRGEFSEVVLKSLEPQSLTLVDMWEAKHIRLELEDAPQNAYARQIFSAYFDGDSEKALNEAFHSVTRKFGSNPRVQILRRDIAEAAKEFPDGHFDVIYLDGTHTYEFVLRDLYSWYPKLAQGGLFVCNDFCESESAALQNMGTIAAYQTFAKRFETYPVALSAWPYSDFYFSNQPQSPLISGFLANLHRTNYNMVELPDELIGAFRHRSLPESGLSTVDLPSFVHRFR